MTQTHTFKKLALAASAAIFLTACGGGGEAHTGASAASIDRSSTKTAVFAGGCFWCVESDFDKVPGVLETTSGFSGGHVDNVTYKQVTRGGTGHYEVVEVRYDPEVVSYDELVTYFWRHVDPTDPGGQFCDRGESYRTAIFAQTDEERATAEASRVALDASGVLDKPIATPVLTFKDFWPAEAYHQDYYTKNPVRYRFYRKSCGRDATIKQVWRNEAMTSEH